MRAPSISQVQVYLRDYLKSKNVKVEYFGPLSEYGFQGKTSSGEKKDIKSLGYGVPYLVVYKSGGKKRESIVSSMRVGKGFGHDFRADRVDNLVLAFDTWGDLPRHCKIQDIGAFGKRDSSMTSLGQAGEFFVLRPKIEGVEYYKDLDRISEKGSLESYDVPRAKALAEYLVTIHRVKPKGEEELYSRKIRDTLGHGECIFGLADSYPREESTDFLRKGELAQIEKKCVDHRWRLKWNSERLAQVHGDFHPWNILFSKDTKRKPTDFLLLDRSRGAFGEPADDVCALSINYIFYSLRKYGRLEGNFQTLYDEFMNTYLKQSRSDSKILEAMPLFYTFRALVIASPLWYPTLSSQTRRQIFNFAENLLDSISFDPTRINDYLEEHTE